MFKAFINNLSREFEKELPGEAAQYKMAPYERSLRETGLKQSHNPPKSAVLALIYPLREQPYITLILRNSYEGVHSDQVGLPGGKQEKEDASLEYTALRETEEEIGVSKEKIKIIGRLTEVFIPPSGYLVHPFVGYVDEKPSFRPDPAEVAAIIETPLQSLTNSNNIQENEIFLQARGIKIKAPCFNIEGYTVWGATAMMLGELKAIIER